MITLKFATTTLADGLPGGTRITGQPSSDWSHEVQDATPIGAEWRTWIDRLLQTQEVTFSVLRENNGTLARRYYRELIGPRSLPGVGTLVLTVTEGAAVHTFTCLGAKKVGPRFRGKAGAADQAEYSFSADKWTYTPPADPEEDISDFLGGRLVTASYTTPRGGRLVSDIGLPVPAIGGREV